MGPDARRSLATVLVVVASLLLAAATLTGYARRAFFDSNQFADRAAATLSDPSVRALVGERVTDGVVLQHEEDLLSARPIIASVISGIVGAPPFRSLFRGAALDAHRAVFERDQNTVALTVADVGTVVATALQVLRPQLAHQIEDTGRIEVVDRDIGSAPANAARIASDVRIAAYLLAALTLAAAVAALVLTPDRRRTASQLGVALIAVGMLIVVAYTIARAVALGRFHDPEDRAAAAAVWSAFLGDLRTFGWVLAGSGAVVAAAAASLVRPVAIEGTLLRAWRIATTEPATTRARLVRAVALIAVGALVIAQPLTAVQVAATLVGVYVAYKGIEAILRLIYRPPDPGEEAARARRAGRLRRRALRLAVPAIAVLLVAGTVVAFLSGGGASAPAATIAVCEGHAALCDKPLDKVVLPATHNSMSAPLKGWFAAEQERSIGAQLEDGIRGLLWDTHYADRLPSGRVRTVIDSREDLELVKNQDGVSDASFAAALRIRDRLGFHGEGTRGMYLCHTLCELGATPLSSGPGRRPRLPRQPSHGRGRGRQPGLRGARRLRQGGRRRRPDARTRSPRRTHGDWPTLRQMIEADHRLVMLAENRAGAAPWYQLVYKRLTEETPFTFPRASLLTTEADLPASCRPNRGPKGAPLFLINHWVSTDPTPRPSDARKVNAYAPLLARARACERIRDHLPNLLAVNFYKRGDVFKVADTLNGL